MWTTVTIPFPSISPHQQRRGQIISLHNYNVSNVSRSLLPLEEVHRLRDYTHSLSFAARYRNFVFRTHIVLLNKTPRAGCQQHRYFRPELPRPVNNINDYRPLSPTNLLARARMPNKESNKKITIWRK